VVSDSSGLLPAPGADQIAVVLGKADGTGEFTVALVTPDGRGGWRVADASRPIVPAAPIAASAPTSPRTACTCA
jgi:hypothetical protein